MKYAEILDETPIPATDYGYWIDTTGAAHSVGHEQHNQSIQKLVNDPHAGSASALMSGWVRIICLHGSLNVDCFPSRLNPKSKATIRKIALMEQYTLIILDDRDKAANIAVRFDNVQKFLQYIMPQRSGPRFSDRVEQAADTFRQRPVTAVTEASTAGAVGLAVHYFHGTPSEDSALAILQHGIVAPDLTGTPNHELRPVQGKVYLTPDIGYAQIYAIGGAFAGDRSFQIPYEGNEEVFSSLFGDRRGRDGRYNGRYGFLFVVDREELTDLQPDEDQVGELFKHCLENGPNEYYDNADHQRWARFCENPQMRLMFTRLMKDCSTPIQIRKIKDGDYGTYARVGKKALAKMTDAMKLWLVSIGLHVAHHGTVMPTQCWRIDKAKSGYLEKNGSNFFEIAERIR